MKIKQADGTEIEVFTQEELDAKVKAATEQATSTATEAAKKVAEDAVKDQIAKMQTDHKTALEAKDKELEEARKAGEGEGEGEGNQPKPGSVEDNQKQLDERFNKMQQDTDTKINEMKNTMTQDFKNTMLDKYVGKDDAELRNKVEAEFNQYRSDEWSQVGIEERVKAAVTIVTGEAAQPAVTDNIANAGGRGDGNPAGNQNKVEVSGDLENLATKMGIKKEEIESANKTT